jgi:hypothetical protein
MLLKPFGEIVYDADDHEWRGRVRLPEFAAYGRAGQTPSLAEPDDDFREGLFAFTVRDEDGTGPTAAQAAAFLYLRENEPAVCRAVMTEILDSQRSGRFLRWLNRKLGFERSNLEDLRPAVRCIGLTISSVDAREFEYIGFDFDVEWGLDLSVVFHPVQGTFLSDRTAIDCIT